MFVMIQRFIISVVLSTSFEI